MNIRKISIALSTALAVSPLSAEDLLGGNDFSFDSTAIEVKQAHWTDGFKTTLEHSHTQIPGDINREQSSLRLEYEGNLAEGWYLKLDSRYRHFWSEDDFAQNRESAKGNNSYGINKWHSAWVQYSRGACTATLGRQTLIWGTVEGTFVTDIISPFDYTEQLLTDYATVRLPQDALIAECFVGDSQIQAFYTPQARTDVFQHHHWLLEIAPGLPPVDMDSVEPEEEAGLRYQWQGSGYDISLMYARLYDNTATPVFYGPPLSGSGSLVTLPAAAIGGNPDFEFRPELARFDMFGMASSYAVGRLLLKAELAHRDRQLLPITGEHTERLDAAVGFEFTTASNHLFNAGLWATHFSNDQADSENIQVLTVGWRKTYLNDNLVASLLGNWSSSPRFYGLTLLGEYQWNDYWSSALALSFADLSKLDTPLPILPAEEAVTLSVKYEF